MPTRFRHFGPSRAPPGPRAFPFPAFSLTLARDDGSLHGGRVQTAARGGCPAAGGFNIGRVQESRSQKVEPRLVLTGSDSRLLDCKFTEQSENVYENTEASQKSTTPGPYLSKEGNFRLPSSDGEGFGVVGPCDLCALCALA